MNTPTLDDTVKKIHFDEIVKKVQDLPTLPGIVMELLNAIDEEDVNISVLAQKVSHDQALTAKTLRFANSSLYGTSSKAATIQQAITFLGMQTVRNLIIAAAMTGCFPERRCAGFDFKAFWRHSMATAICAKSLARHIGSDQDQAYTAGLLHDIGRLVLVTRFPQHYEKAIAYRIDHDCHMLEAEREVLGIDHVQAGSALAMHWSLSETLRHAIAGHHEPETQDGITLAAIVHVADAIAHALDLSGIEDDVVPPISFSAWNGMNLDEPAYIGIFRETLSGFEQVNQILLA